MTVSLGDPWEDGFCYKLAAGILAIESAPVEKVEPVDQPMDAGEAARILQALAAGMDPFTGHPIGGGGPLSHPATVDALRAAAAALRAGPPGKTPRELPAQAGKPWDTVEDEMLATEFDAGETMAAMARAHGRTRGAIKARLVRLGKIEG